MPGRVSKDLQRDASHWRTILLHLEEHAAAVTKRLIQARENPASSLFQAHIRSLLLRLDLIKDRHSEDEPHSVHTGQDRPRDLIVRTKLQERVGVQGKQSARALPQLLPLLERLDGLGKTGVLVVDLLVDDPGSIGRCGMQPRDVPVPVGEHRGGEVSVRE
jgi:hypothetical protein